MASNHRKIRVELLKSLSTMVEHIRLATEIRRRSEMRSIKLSEWNFHEDLYNKQQIASQNQLIIWQ